MFKTQFTKRLARDVTISAVGFIAGATVVAVAAAPAKAILGGLALVGTGIGLSIGINTGNRIITKFDEVMS